MLSTPTLKIFLFLGALSQPTLAAHSLHNLSHSCDFNGHLHDGDKPLYLCLRHFSQSIRRIYSTSYSIFRLGCSGGSSDSACLKQLVTFHAKASPPAAATQLAKSLGHSVTGLWPHQVSLCFSNTQAHSQLQVVPPEISSSWKAFLPALGVPGSSPYLLPNTRAISESPKPAPPPSASRPSWTHHCFYLLHGTT